MFLNDANAGEVGGNDFDLAYGFRGGLEGVGVEDDEIRQLAFLILPFTFSSKLASAPRKVKESKASATVKASLGR